jgi:multidrug efflux pump subunit AcrA (membrane-fusion protein)
MKIRIAVSILLILLVSAVTAVGVYVISDVEEKPRVEPTAAPVPVEVAEVVAADFVHRIEALGTISAVREGAVSAEISGRVVAIPATIALGSVVQAGELLAQVDATDFEIAVRKAAAQVASARARVRKAAVDIARQRKLVRLNGEQLRLARAEHQRLAKLLKKELVSDQEAERQELAWRRIEEELESAKSGERETEALHAIAEAELALAEVQLEQARETLSDTEIRAPFAGVIARKNVTLGERVAPGQVLFQLADVGTVKLEVRIPAADIHRLGARVAASVRVPGLEDRFTGRVANIGPRADQRTRSFPVEILMSNSSGRKLLPGMFARALIPIRDYPAAILIPRESVVFEDGKPAVFVADPDSGRAARREVAIARRFGPRYMISAGLEPGEWLVTAGQRLLLDGTRIRVVTRRDLST